MAKEKEITFQQAIINIGNSLITFSNKINEFTQKHSKDIIKGTIKICEIISKIDFEKIDKEIQNTMAEYLKLGFYPSKTCIGHKEPSYLLEFKDYKDKVLALSKDVEYYLEIIKPKLLNTFNNKEKYIIEIYDLYKNEEYRLCILSLINLTANIYNENLNNIDFTEEYNVRKKLIDKKVMDKDEKNYIIFAPYINNKLFYSNNTLIKSYQRKPKKYNYNRNAILHGYSIDFGTKENCLRWFSVLINTYDIFEILINIINQKSNNQ